MIDVFVALAIFSLAQRFFYEHFNQVHIAIALFSWSMSGFQMTLNAQNGAVKLDIVEAYFEFWMNIEIFSHFTLVLLLF